MAKQKRQYSLEFKLEAVRLVREQNMTYAAAGADLGVDSTTIRDWCVKAAAGTLGGSRTPAPERSSEDELAALRRENRILREEREILKKAAAFFAKETR